MVNKDEFSIYVNEIELFQIFTSCLCFNFTCSFAFFLEQDFFKSKIGASCSHKNSITQPEHFIIAVKT